MKMWDGKFDWGGDLLKINEGALMVKPEYCEYFIQSV